MLKRSVIALSLIALMPASALATGLIATQIVERMVTTETDDGALTVEFVEATTVVPGEILAYWLEYQNSGEQSAENVVLTVPVPGDVTYVENSATMSSVVPVFSTDGGATFAPRGHLTVSVNGVERKALAEEITHIRWMFTSEIPVGEQGKLGFQATLN